MQKYDNRAEDPTMLPPKALTTPRFSQRILIFVFN